MQVRDSAFQPDEDLSYWIPIKSKHFLDMFQINKRNSCSLTRLIFSGVSFDDMIVEPHVSDSHSVLSQCSRLVWADSWGGSKRLDSLQILDQAVLGSHSLGSESQADGDSGQQTFWHVSDNDTNEEDDSIKPVVAENESDDEEGDAKKDGHTGDDVDKMFNLQRYTLVLA